MYIRILGNMMAKKCFRVIFEQNDLALSVFEHINKQMDLMYRNSCLNYKKFSSRTAEFMATRKIRNFVFLNGYEC